ncbi:oxidoreductase, partial [Lacticaseibacillus rhamnosus MTCC 5462]
EKVSASFVGSVSRGYSCVPEKVEKDLINIKALFFTEFGDADVLQYGTLPDPEVGPEDVLVKTRFIGLNFADIYRRRGHYHIENTHPILM